MAIVICNYDVISDVGMEAPDSLKYFILLGLYGATLYAQKGKKNQDHKVSFSNQKLII